MERQKMNVKLHHHLKRFPVRKFQRGLTDCCAFAAQWAEIMCGKLPASHLLCRELTDKQAYKIIKDHGGMLELVSSELELLGWTPVKKPYTGDIVVAAAEGGFAGRTVGVWSGSSLITVHEKGWISLGRPKKIEGVWRWE